MSDFAAGRSSALAVIALALAPGLSHAQSSSPPPTADSVSTDVRDLLRRGFDARRAGFDVEALGLFRTAYERSPSPRVLAQVALCEQAIGQWVRAERDLDEALRSSTDRWIATNAGALRESLTTIRAHLGALEVIANVPGAEVWLDGVLVAHTPLSAPLRVPLGDARIEVRAAGHHGVLRVAHIESGALSRESVELSVVVAASPSPEPSGAPSSSPSPAVLAMVASSAPPRAITPHPVAEQTAGTPSYVGPAVAAAAGLAAFAIAGGLHAMQLGAEGDMRATCAGFDDPATADVVECASWLHPEAANTAAQTDATAANVSIAIGTVAVLAAGGWLAATLLRRPADRRAIGPRATRVQFAGTRLEVRWP